MPLWSYERSKIEVFRLCKKPSNSKFYYTLYMIKNANATLYFPCRSGRLWLYKFWWAQPIIKLLLRGAENGQNCKKRCSKWSNRATLAPYNITSIPLRELIFHLWVQILLVSTPNLYRGNSNFLGKVTVPPKMQKMAISPNFNTMSSQFLTKNVLFSSITLQNNHQISPNLLYFIDQLIIKKLKSYRGIRMIRKYSNFRTIAQTR